MSPGEGKPFNIYLEEDRKCRQIAERQLGKYYDYFSTYEAQYHYDNVFVQCMTSHGNRILYIAINKEAPLNLVGLLILVMSNDLH